MNSLPGRVSGVISSTGGTGSSSSMLIRSASFLTNDNQSLFDIDSIPMNNTLNNVTEMARNILFLNGVLQSDVTLCLFVYVMGMMRKTETIRII